MTDLTSRIPAGALVVCLTTLTLLVGTAGLALAGPQAAGLIVTCSACGVFLWRFLRRFAIAAGKLTHTQRDALTDALTSLGNRRKLMDDLGDAFSAAQAGHPRQLVLFDLDGFKRYNDAYGHPAGDALLARLGARLDAAVGSDGFAYRLGGDEFCILLAGSPRSVEITRSARMALTEEGEGFTVGASSGAVVLPLEAETPEHALQIADQRLYAEKDARRRNAPPGETRQLLAQALSERARDNEELGCVPGLARAVGRALSLDGEELEVTVRAAELHDIGMLSVPEVILHKAGPLDPLEREIICQHPLVGERILGTAPALLPVAQVVRATHERWDGGGYPDGTAGEAIPRPARIVSACVALEAMVSFRPYRAAKTRAAALDELSRCAGKQFDPQVADVLRTLVASGAIALRASDDGRISDLSTESAGRSHQQGPRSHGSDGNARKGNPR